MLHAAKQTTIIPKIILLACSLLVYIISYLIISSYSYDDTAIYRDAYKDLRGLKYTNLYIVYFQHIGSFEPVHMHLTWGLSNIGLSYEGLQSFLNSLLTYFTLKLTIDNNQKRLVLVLMIISSFYFFILFYQLDRLKLAMMFMLWYSERIHNGSKYSFFLIPIMILTHVQVVILLVALMISKEYRKFLRVFNGIITKKLIVFLTILIVLFLLLDNHIIGKFKAYAGDIDSVSVVKIFIWPVVIWLIKPNLLYVLTTTTPIICSAIIFGSERINILGYFLALLIILTQTDRNLIRNMLLLNIYPIFKLVMFLNIFFNAENRI